MKQAPRLSLVLMIAVYATSPAISQVGTRGPVLVLDGTPAPRPNVRNDDVVLVKTVWQRIDVREKMNQRLAFPAEDAQHHAALFELLKDGLLNERVLTAYSAGAMGDNDMFTEPMSREEVQKLLISKDTVFTPDIYGDTLKRVVVENEIGADDIIAYEVKEHWYIDKQRSVMDVRIIGICPIQAVMDSEDGSFRGFKRLFWIYYPDARHAFARWPVFDPHSDTQYISYDDLFVQRRFTAHMVKISNVHDRAFVEYLEPMDALLSGHYEREKLRNLELDMWNY